MQIPDVTPVDLLAQRPDVIAAEYNLIAQNARVGAAQGNRLPSISVTGLLGVAGNELSNISLSNPLWNLGGQIVGPLFYWGQLKRQVDIEKSRRYQAFYQYENTVFNALKEVEDVLAEIRTTRTEINIAEARRNAAIEAETLSKERYSKGVTSYLEFLEQQRQSFDAQLLLEELRAQLLSAYVRYYKALGGGWLTEEEKKAAEAAEAEQKKD
jgi:multidrug efflux system outer membrane protein